MDDLEVHVSSRNRNFTQRTVSCIHKGTVRVVGITQLKGKKKSRNEPRVGGKRDSQGKTIAARTKEKTKWEQDDKIGQRTKNTKTRRGRGGGRKKKKNKNEKIDEDVDNSTAADETEEEKLKPKKKKRKYTRRKKSSVIPRVTTTSSTGRVRKPSTKYAMG